MRPKHKMGTETARAIDRGYHVSALRMDPTPVIEARFLADGRAGANADTNHPLRARWEAARIVLRERGATNV